jgi:hypothetical protein
MHSIITGKGIFCEVERLLQKYEPSQNELLCLVTDSAPAQSGCKNGVSEKLTAKVSLTPNFQYTVVNMIMRQAVLYIHFIC